MNGQVRFVKGYSDIKVSRRTRKADDQVVINIKVVM